jgi:hypothetical protein
VGTLQYRTEKGGMQWLAEIKWQTELRLQLGRVWNRTGEEELNVGLIKTGIKLHYKNKFRFSHHR